MSDLYGYAGKILRVDMGKGTALAEELGADILQSYVGGAALGIKFIYDEVPPGVAWSDPENRLFLGSGPLGGSRIGGSGTICLTTKGAMTEGMTSSQANGFFGAFLRFAGFDAIILQGAAPAWSYLYVHDGVAELKDARELVGKNTYEVDEILKRELNKGEHDVSVMSIGPAGENLARFACVFTDLGHIAAHNGVGAVMGSKKLKAIVIGRSKSAITFKDPSGLAATAQDFLAYLATDKGASMARAEGTVGGVLMGTANGSLPVKNYTTSINTMTPETLSTYHFQAIRDHFGAKPNPCWACSAKHCHMMVVPDGKYAGRVFEEPEYEGMAAFSALTGVQDVTMTVVLASEVDRLGLDINEAGWLMAWLIECFEKRILTRKDTDGLEMTWGNGEAIMSMLNKTARREGFGNILAEGVRRASQQIGGEAAKYAIYGRKGNTPRGHDHRSVWLEMFDTCVSNTGTLEAHQMAPMKLLGITSPFEPFNPEMVATIDAKIKGAMIFEDSMVTCRFNTATRLDLLCQAVKASTGWEMDVEGAMRVGRRAVNLARVFNLRHGIKPELDAPSMRYGSTPLDGVAAGRGILPHWDKMLAIYYRTMGWDEQGKPLPQTLKDLGLERVIAQLPA